MRLKLLVTAAMFAAGLTAHAATVTDTITFTATSFYTNTASGSFTLTFDPTMTYTDQTAGLTVNYLNDGLTAPSSVGFDFDPATGQLDIGGTFGTVGVLYGAGNIDELLVINNFLTSPTFLFFDASDTTTGPYYDYFGSGTVSVTTQTNVAATPEPSSIALLGTGLLGVTRLLRKRLA